MEKTKLGQDAAFPMRYKDDKHFDAYITEIGISKRFYAACAAMQGLLANTEVRGILSGNNGMQVPELIVNSAYEYADELLKQENK